MLELGALAAAQFASGYLQGVQQSNQMQRRSYYYQQQGNAYRQNAAMTRLNGAINEDVSRAKNRAYLSRATAAAGEAGMAESPTFTSALSSTAAALEQNVLNQRYQTESEAENYLYQARIAEENARVMRKNSRHAFRNGLINGITSAFGFSTVSGYNAF